MKELARQTDAHWPVHLGTSVDASVEFPTRAEPEGLLGGPKYRATIDQLCIVQKDVLVMLRWLT